MLVDAINPAFQDRKIAFDGVGVGLAANIFLLGMVDSLVRDKVPAKSGIGI